MVDVVCQYPKVDQRWGKSVKIYNLKNTDNHLTRLIFIEHHFQFHNAYFFQEQIDYALRQNIIQLQY